MMLADSPRTLSDEEHKTYKSTAKKINNKEDAIRALSKIMG